VKWVLSFLDIMTGQNLLSWLIVCLVTLRTYQSDVNPSANLVFLNKEEEDC